MSSSSLEDDFSCNYRDKLSELSFASKPLINALTMLADEYRHYAGKIVTIITQKLQSETSIEARLPLLYLMDSILKNIKGTTEFKAHISAQLPSIFIYNYKNSLTNEKHRQTLLKLYNLWRDGKWLTDDALLSMGTVINQYNANNNHTTSNDPRKRNLDNVTSTNIVKNNNLDNNSSDNNKRMRLNGPKPLNPEIERVLSNLQQSLLTLPHLLPLLHDLRQSVQDGLDNAGIQAKIANLVNAIKMATMNPNPAVQPPINTMNQPYGSQPQTQNFSYGPGAVQSFVPQPQPPLQQPNPYNYNNMGINHMNIQQTLPFNTQQTSQQTMLYNTQALVQQQQQQQQQVINSNNFDSQTNNQQNNNIIMQQQQQQQQQKQQEDHNNNNSTVNNNGNSSSSVGLSDNVIVNSLYSGMKLQCKQCGLRFNDADLMSSHLDFHFKMNRRATKLTKHTAHTLYYWTEEEWIHSDDVIFGLTTNQPWLNNNNEENNTDNTANSNDTLSNSTSSILNPRTLAKVIVDDNQSQCPVCSERFESVWDNEEECWIYKGALRVNPELSNNISSVDKNAEKKRLIIQQYQGKILHTLCFESLLASFQTKIQIEEHNTENDNNNTESTATATTDNNNAGFGASIKRVLSSASAAIMAPFSSSFTNNPNNNAASTDIDQASRDDVMFDETDLPPLEVDNS